MSSLLYLSRTNGPLDAATIDDIALTSSLANANIDVTGYLTFGEPNFVQYLEGSTSAVKSLLDRIRKDQRHEILTVVELGESGRRFPDWSMQLLDPLWHASAGPVQAVFDLLAACTASSPVDQSVVETLRDLVTNISASR